MAEDPDRYDLGRFVAAQDRVIDAVLRELQNGRKESHWMWFVFPQLAGLGSSPMARRFAISSLAEAQAYLDHPVLGPRLVQCTEIVNAARSHLVADIFGYPDDLKFHSSMTLFDRVAPGKSVFSEALDRFFAGRRDERTLELLREG